MQKIVLYAIFFAFFSCVNLKYKKHVPSKDVAFEDAKCREIFNFISNNWYTSRRMNLYFSSSKFHSDFISTYLGCIKTLTFNEVEKLLGAANYKDDISMFYYIGENCASPLKENCQILLFVKGESGTVNHISFQRADLLK